MQFSIQQIPFSRRGSYLAFSRGPRVWREGGSLNPDTGIWLRHVEDLGIKEMLRVELLIDGKPVECETVGTPSALVLKGPEGGEARVVMPEPSLIRLHGEGAGLRFSLCEGVHNCGVPGPEGRFQINAATAFRWFMATPMRGRLAVDAPWGVARCERVVVDFLPDGDGVMEGALEEFFDSWKRRNYDPDFKQCEARVAAEFSDFADKCPQLPERYDEARKMAAYVDWTSIVAPRGLLKRPTMLMSKNWMTKCWSWDHCFNALALAKEDLDAAWDQFMAPFDFQSENGQLPDYVSSVNVSGSFVKPPIHGWTLRRMRKSAMQMPRPMLEEIYPKLCRWTDWWFAVRNPEGDLLPSYYHGNDSGWDNATVFDVGLPAKGPDLAAFLVVQMDVLAELAGALDLPDDSRMWSDRADLTLGALLDNLWQEDRFVVKHAVTGETNAAERSLLPCLPIILGPRLPEKVRSALVERIREMATPYGLPSEAVDSPLYVEDGYWRGPIWAPPMMLICDGLEQAGEERLAADLARRFCDLCAAHGMAENFDPLSGKALKDTAYTWTSSIFLILAHRFGR